MNSFFSLFLTNIKREDLVKMIDKNITWTSPIRIGMSKVPFVANLVEKEIAGDHDQLFGESGGDGERGSGERGSGRGGGRGSGRGGGRKSSKSGADGRKKKKIVEIGKSSKKKKCYSINDRGR